MVIIDFFLLLNYLFVFFSTTVQKAFIRIFFTKAGSISAFRKQLDPEPDPDLQEMNADPQPWLYHEGELGGWIGSVLHIMIVQGTNRFGF